MSFKRTPTIPPMTSFVNIVATFAVTVLVGIGYFSALADLPVTL